MKHTPTHIFVGSTNPVKINSVREATADHWPALEIVGFEVASGVSEQPMSDAATREGAHNRAIAALRAGVALAPTAPTKAADQNEPSQSSKLHLGVGLEGGVFCDAEGDLWSTVWVSVVDQQGTHWDANGARFKVPAKIAEPIKKGAEMGPVLSEMFSGADVRRQNGAIGIVTNNFVTRTTEYAAICKLALGLWYGQDWATTIEIR
ncbi:DUF84 family protein [Candidatus Woesebacteria bacterium]|nr:DUF84 family protein [Candidatus Woesebacteria bacterium]